jgi:hypothetical protein
MNKLNSFRLLLLSFFLIILTSSCERLVRTKYVDPEVELLSYGIQTSVSLGYCASLAYTYFKEENLPQNVTIFSENYEGGIKTVILKVLINETYPLPLNSQVGQITIYGTWDDDRGTANAGGAVTAIFTDINIFEGVFDFYGFETVPIKEMENGRIEIVFGKQDLMVGVLSDDFPDFSISAGVINYELTRLDENSSPEDAYVAIGMKAWFTKINRNNTPSNIYDDEYTIDGGGQLFGDEANFSGTILHALLNTKFQYSNCKFNPSSGVGFIQNAGANDRGDTDFGHVFLDFHNSCDGRAHVKVATGKYLLSLDKNLDLNLN